MDVGNNGRQSDGGVYVFSNSCYVQAIEAGHLPLPNPCPLPGTHLNQTYLMLWSLMKLFL